jgi:acetolactate synthase-1/2/3 large subunit
MKLSDYIVSFLEDKGVKDVFLLSGGGIMHILDSLSQSKKINKYYNLHEQASGFCADGYALYTGKTGVCLVTTGPGGTNTVTAVASSFIDSTPIVYISGQVKTSTISHIPGVRQTGAQEADIISIVKPITKYAVTILQEKDIRYHLEKAFYIANHERPGPVWLEVPLDIQSKQVDIEQLRAFDPFNEGYKLPAPPAETDIAEIYNLLRNAKRPVIMAGSGIRLAHAEEIFKQLVQTLKIPVVSSVRVRDLLKNSDDEFYFGSVGALPNRYANYILQNSDFMLSIGSGLRYYLTAYDDSNFAPKATRVIVNIHNAELEKLNMEGAKKIIADAADFIDAMLAYPERTQPSRAEWLSYCNKMKEKYPSKDEYVPENSAILNPFIMTHCISEYLDNEDILTISPSAFDYAWNVLNIKGDQRFISHIGLGAMGTALPVAIGACIASGKRTIVFEGDGSLQPNIQELALLRQYNLPIKLFIESNRGYKQIYKMQNSHFEHRHAGCSPESGMSFPDLKLITQAYGLNYIKIDDDYSMKQRIREVLINNEPAIIEVITSLDMECGLPIMKSKMNSDGTMQTPSMELLYPFLPEEEHKDNMKISEDESNK